MKTFFFFGDSITLGVNDTLAGGWIGRFAGLASQRAGLPVPPSTFYNLGVRKHSSLQIRERWASEYRSRVNDATVPYLIFCFGTVDMAAPNGNVAVPMQESTQNAQAILSEAQMKAPVLMMGPPPVKNPDHLERLNKLNETYAGSASISVSPILIFSKGSPPYTSPIWMTGSIREKRETC